MIREPMVHGIDTLEQHTIEQQSDISYYRQPSEIATPINNQMDPTQEHPPAMMGYPPPMRRGPPPPTNRTSGGGGGGNGSGGPPQLPPYLSNNPATKYPPYTGPPPPGSHAHHYRAPPPPPPSQHSTPVESRYPPSSSRHEDYSRHPPPTRLSGPPPVHYSSSFPPGEPPPQLSDHRHPGPPPPGPALPSTAATAAASSSAAPSRLAPRPHPADKFGKTITVSSRTSISGPPSWQQPPPQSIHSPRAPPPNQPHPSSSHQQAPHTPSAHPAVAVLRPAPTTRSDATVHFSPSRNGSAFLPYRPVARRMHPARTPPPGARLPAQFVPPPPPRAVVEIVNVVEDDIVDMCGEEGEEEVVVEKFVEKELSVTIAVERRSGEDDDDADDDLDDQEVKEVNRTVAEDKERPEHGLMRSPNVTMGSTEEHYDHHDTKVGQVEEDHPFKGKSSNPDQAATTMKESRDDNNKKGSFGADEVHQDHEKAVVAASATMAAAAGKPAASSSDSMEISEELPIKDTASNEASEDTKAATNAEDKEKLTPAPISTTPKRPRSAYGYGRDNSEITVNVDDDTPKHINISRYPNHGSNVFRYTPNSSNASNNSRVQNHKRLRLSEDTMTDPRNVPTRSGGYHDNYYKGGNHQGGNSYPPPDLSHMKGERRRSYSLESIEEDRQDQPTTSAYSHRSQQPYGSNEYYYNGDHQERQRSMDNNPHHNHPNRNQVLSRAPSQDRSQGGIRESWGTLHPTNSQEYLEPASYLNVSRSLSWEVPAGTLSAIGSTLSFGWNAMAAGSTTPGAAASTLGASAALGAPAVPTPGGPGGDDNGEEVRVVGVEDSQESSGGERNRGPGGANEGFRGGTTTEGANSNNDDDDDIPPLLSTGSLPPRKRAMLAPRPSGPSNQLFEPPRPPPQQFEPPRSGTASGGREEGRQGGRQVEALQGAMREQPASSRYAPATVHYPHERRQAPPQVVRSYPHDYHHQQQRYGDPHYDARYKDYEPPRSGGNHGGPPGSSHRGSHHGRYADPRDPHHAQRGGGGVDRRDPYPQSPGRYPEYAESSRHPPPPKTPPQPPANASVAPWGSPPQSSSNRPRSDSHHNNNNNLFPHPNNTPGGDSSHNHDLGGGSRSFDSSLSKRSFRSLDDLDDPMTSLLYRPSFSWEQGLDSNTANNVGGPPHHVHSSGHPPGGHSGGGHPHHAAAGGHGYGGHGGHHGGPHPPPHGGHHPPGHPPPNPTIAKKTTMIQLRDQQKIMKALTMRNEVRTIGNPSSPVGLILLLAMPQDRHCLSETLCIVRNNVEVFTATDADINAPAPGRKRPIQIGQVGLRCVYCRMCNTRDRVKRATCFPSSMKRIYRAVIDMKLDHFKNCPYVPPGLKTRLDQLQAGSTRSTGMTVQYFVKSAKEMGMVDLEDGVTIDLKRVGKADTVDFMDAPGMGNKQRQQGSSGMVPYVTYPKRKGRQQHQQQQQQNETKFAPQSNNAPPSSSVPFQAGGRELMADQQQQQPCLAEKRYPGKVLLTLPDDTNFLSPLRCFLREHVCAFTATARDIAVRTPTTFSVRVGQVGVGCIHCLSVPPKSRSNRAVCFPFTVARIYQSVADIQRFHLGECRMMPPDVRATFLRLQSESAKGSRGLATRTYWVDSAKKIGLADGPAGMYFCRDPLLPPPPPDSDAESLDLLAQVASGNNESIGKEPLVTLQDKPTIAEFLFLVMEQLRPCRFTDADRNKRRSKNVGSIGVECKHCAGKIDGRKFFWSSVSAAESNFVSVHSHMLGCKYIPDGMKVELTRLKALRREQTSRLKTGSQKAFFTRVWARLHGTTVPAPTFGVKQLAASLGNDAKGGSKLAKKIHHPKGTCHGMKEVVIDAPIRKEAGAAADDEPLIDLHTGRSNDSDEIRALLESKSALSSVDESLILKHGNDNSESELKPDQSSESAGELLSKSSLTSMALNLSAVSVHCEEEQNSNVKMTDI